MNRNLLAIFVTACFSWPPAMAAACPFCSSVSPTFAEEMQGARSVIIAVLREQADCTDAGQSTDACGVGEREFYAMQILRGPQLRMIPAFLLGDAEPGASFYLTANEMEGELSWSLPIPVSPVLAEYLANVSQMPLDDPGRLRFFYDFLEHPEPLISADAYSEFGRAPYSEVRRLGSLLNREHLLRLASDPKVSFSRRRLYITLLGICGNADDAEAVRAMIESTEPEFRSTLDAALACYVSLAGERGLEYLEQQFLQKAPFDESLALACIAAIRFHGEEDLRIPRSRLLRSLRLVLDHPPAADLVLADLARWNDWSQINRVVELFQNTGDDSWHIRVPVARYLLACPLSEAEVALAQLERQHPQSVRDARLTMLPRGRAAGNAAATPAATMELSQSPVHKIPETVVEAPSEEFWSRVPVSPIVSLFALIVMGGLYNRMRRRTFRRASE